MRNTDAVTTSESLKVLALANRLLSAGRDDAHFQAVQSQCTSAIEVYTGVLQLVETQNGISAQALVRTLFEAIVGAVILVKHPEMLNDFRNHGKLTALRIARSIPRDSPFAKKLQIRRAAASAEYDALYHHFKATGHWHHFKTKASFTEAELPEDFYERYYARASSIAHGNPFVVLQPLDEEAKNWGIQSRPRQWKKWAAQARVLSMLLMLHMVESVARAFALGLGPELRKVRQEVAALANSEMKSASS
jgi:Family of unknown function (DUF5677)